MAWERLGNGLFSHDKRSSLLLKKPYGQDNTDRNCSQGHDKTFKHGFGRHDLTLVRSSEPALDSGQGFGACTGLWSGVWSLRWTLVRGSEPALDSGQGFGACAGLWSGVRSLNWTLVRSSEPAPDSGHSHGACTGLWSKPRSLHWTLVRGSERTPGLEPTQKRTLGLK